MAANITPKIPIFNKIVLLAKRISFSFQDFNSNMVIAINTTIPLSPIRLYIIACIADLLASDRVNHHPIKIKDIIPTPSQPTNRTNRLFEETSNIINNKNKVKVLIKEPFFGSVDM